MKKHKPADSIQDIQYFGEYGGVNHLLPTLLRLHIWQEKLWKWYSEENVKAVICIQEYMNPSTGYLVTIAKMENTDAAHVSASGMGSISTNIMQLCKSGDHIVSSRTIYGGTYAYMKNFLPRLNISTSFVDTTNLTLLNLLF